MKKLLYIIFILSHFGLIAQEVADYSIKPIRIVPRLSAVRTLDSGIFKLQPIDLTIDLRMQALRKQNGFSMLTHKPKVETKFKVPNLSPKTQESKKAIQFSVEARDYDVPFSNTYGYGNTFYGRRYVPYIPPANR